MEEENRMFIGDEDLRETLDEQLQVGLAVAREELKDAGITDA